MLILSFSVGNLCISEGFEIKKECLNRVKRTLGAEKLTLDLILQSSEHFLQGTWMASTTSTVNRSWGHSVPCRIESLETSWLWQVVHGKKCIWKLVWNTGSLRKDIGFVSFFFFCKRKGYFTLVCTYISKGLFRFVCL